MSQMNRMSELTPPPAPLDQEEFEPGHILVVDDNEMNRDLLSRRLLRQGHTVEVAVDGRHALEMITAGDFDLVLLDLMMPEMNGYELLGHLRASETLRHLPVILISALDDTDSVVRGIRMGADDHLPKPFNPHILRARVRSCLARKRLRDREQVHARSLEREMDIARQIQAGFLPDVLPAPAGWDVAARFQPARRVGGDFYDAFPLGDGNRVALVVADVCDKGVGAALFMALFRSLTRALADRVLTTGGDVEKEISALVMGVNDYIARTHDSANMFATLFIGVLNPVTGELVYVNGGHDAPVITGSGGVRARLHPTGPAVGMLPAMEYGVDRNTIAPGETLFAFTDGVADARNPAGEPFTEERLLALLSAPSHAPAATLDRVETAVREHSGGAPPFDDVTLLAALRF